MANAWHGKVAIILPEDRFSARLVAGRGQYRAWVPGEVTGTSPVMTKWVKPAKLAVMTN
jgi:hypothetical protein